MTQIPTAWTLPDGLLRIAFSARDKNNRGQLLAVDVDPNDGMRIVCEHCHPILALEDCPGFAKDGIGPGHALFVESCLFLYGTSLNLDVKPYTTSIVLLRGDNNGLSFSMPQEVLSSRDNGGYPVAQPTVMKIEDNFHLWYTALEEWRLDADPHPDSTYRIRHAISGNGIDWIPDTNLAVDFNSDIEVGLARPSVLRKDEVFEMWFSVRGSYSLSQPTLRHYRLGYARSLDGQTWQRCDKEHGFLNPPLPGDWDHGMQCYPNVIETAGGMTYMFYSGNWYGAGGFGYAVRQP